LASEHLQHGIARLAVDLDACCRLERLCVRAATVTFGSTPGTNVAIVSSKSLTVTAPAASAAGSVDITVTTPGGTSKKSSKDLYAYGAPTITLVHAELGDHREYGDRHRLRLRWGAGEVRLAGLRDGHDRVRNVTQGHSAQRRPRSVDDHGQRLAGQQTSSAQFSPTMSITGLVGIHTTSTGGPAGPSVAYHARRSKSRLLEINS
jgi:hypothetical protein